jgi:endoglucanase
MDNHHIKKIFRTLKIYGSVLATLLFCTQVLAVQCDYAVNDWGSSFSGEITITNDNSEAIEGWTVSWTYPEETSIVNIWNAELSGSNPFQATNLTWNSTIKSGESVEFGFQAEGSDSEATITSCSAVSADNGSDGSSSGDSSSDDSSSTDDSDSSTSPAVALTEEMGAGWNAGNSLDAVGGETAWGNPELTQELFDAVKAAGFKTVRLPIAWSKFSDEDNYVIKDSWLDRVEEVVNYALNDDLYVIINIHWDGGWMQPTYDDQESVNNRLAIMWEQIATRFKDYDYRLLFAGTNEVMVEGDYSEPTYEYYTVQNSYNQTFVSTVRGTGGKNADRFLVVQGFNTNIDYTVNYATIPSDSATNRLLMEVHYYDPYNFTLNENSSITQWGSIATDSSKTETWANESYVDSQFQKMKTNFVDKGVGVILGEYGVISRLSVSDHETYRVYWNKYITQSAIDHNLVPIYWDNGYSADHGMALFDRSTTEQLYPDIIQAIVQAVE